MAIFKYVLPSGAEFQLNAPNGTTQAEADKIFYEQVASGTFVGYRVGDTLSHPEEAFTNFGLTRQERGTAGVDDNALLAVIQNLPLSDPLPNLNGIAVENPVNQADVVLATDGLLPASGIGSLSGPQVQTLIAQAAASANQGNELTDNGLGAYGLSASQLERACYLKPGTVDKYLGGAANNTISNPANFKQVLGTPGIWTGKDGVTSADMLLANPELQTKVQNSLMKSSYTTLVNKGVISPPPPPASQQSTASGQIYSGNQTLVATTALTVIAAGLGYNGTNTLFKDFTNLFSSPTQTGLDIATKIPGGDTTSLTSGAVSQAAGAVAGITGAAASVAQITDVNSALTAANKLTTAANQDVGALIAASSKVGTDVTTAWAKGADVLNNPDAVSDKLIAGAQDKAKALYANVEGQAKAVYDGVVNQAETLVAQGKQAIDNIAKAAKNAVAFADTKLSSLVAGVQKGAAFSNTVDRSTVDTAVTRVIGSEKIPSPTFELPNLQSLGIQQDIAKAQEVLKAAQETSQAIINQGQQLYAQGSAVVAQTQGAVTNAQGQFTNIVNKVPRVG